MVAQISRSSLLLYYFESFHYNFLSILIQSNTERNIKDELACLRESGEKLVLLRACGAVLGSSNNATQDT